MAISDTHFEAVNMDSRIQNQVPALLALAYDRSEQGRLKLAEKLAEVFLYQAAALTEHEEKLVGDLIDDLLKHENPRVRHALIHHFAESISAPRPLAVRIASGPLDLAEPILVANENLEDADLIQIVESKSREHAMAIAARKEISQAVADALITTGDIRVMQIVAENLGAKLSPRALDVLIDAARLTAKLQQPLLSRPEINPESALRLYWWVTQDLRREALERFGFGPGRLEEALSKAIENKLNAHLLEKDDDATMKGLADWLEERGAMTTKILPQLLRAGHYRLFNILLGRMTQLELPLVDALTNAAGGRIMVALCRALNIDKGNFVSIFLMSRGGRSDEQIVHPKELSESLAAFDRLTPNKAQAMIESWRRYPDDILNRIAEA